ncbi:DUF5992 family protein [Grimontia sp. NTOU-MAR1]|uniref:DUF5992 family protein n=1 Tax=Grimontia sp. NTOU-MAR1 TaxID=3111011 RepID=UPI002DB99570|nr:DUF5992 family protein [Grimontia sp. NTOU-MAR1]WRV97967.1 DUF5992 family protein [Grimontia sp. NTOU-MAR1]
MTRIISLSLVLFATVSHAEYIVKDAIITSIANTNSNGENFTVWVEGGSGPCTDRAVTFPRRAVSSNEIHARAYSAALSALSTNHKVDIYDYSGSNCGNASYIRLH